jgi:ATP-dependent RNA helicase RhlE
MHFQDLKLIAPLLRAVEAEGYTSPTPIQEHAIPHVLAGSDLIACAQTGTGKTAAFALPILQRLMQAPRKQASPAPRVLVLSPTRELAAQIGESFNVYGVNTPLRTLVVFGGVGIHPQMKAARAGIDILVATPGRLLDILNQKATHLNNVEVFVLDEADRMLDMGFIHDVKKVIAQLPASRQNLLFSATMPNAVRDLASSFLRNPQYVEVTPPATTVEKIDQSVYFVTKTAKIELLKYLLHDRNLKRVLVFTQRKHIANKVSDMLTQSGVSAEAIHGNKSQSARIRALENFRSGATRVLVATDLAARGIDVDDVTHVINYEMTHEPDVYVHRIGRTARMGATGVAYSFVDETERDQLRAIERNSRLQIPVVNDHPFADWEPIPTVRNDAAPRPKGLPPRHKPARPGAPANGNGKPKAKPGQQQPNNKQKSQPQGQNHSSKKRRSTIDG